MCHEFKAFDGATGFACTRMVMRYDGGDSCGHPPEHPIHRDDTETLAEVLAEPLCRAICDLLGEPRVLVPGEVSALLTRVLADTSTRRPHHRRPRRRPLGVRA